jgi:hypothetical protein
MLFIKVNYILLSTRFYLLSPKLCITILTFFFDYYKLVVYIS